MPDWLPAKFCVDPWKGNTYEILYLIFCRDIRDSELKYCSYRIWFFPEKEDGKETIFWHLTSREQKKQVIPRRMRKYHKEVNSDEKTRFPDLRRSERLPWVKPMVEHPGDSELLCWNYLEGDGSIKTYVWLKDLDFVVIMKKYEDESRRLVTSFYVDSEFKKNDLERKYVNRIK